MKTPTPPAAESAPQTPRVTALVRELYRLKSNTLRYPCETALRQLAEELEKEHAAAQQRIGELAEEVADYHWLIGAGAKWANNSCGGFDDVRPSVIRATRLALRHPERT